MMVKTRLTELLMLFERNEDPYSAMMYAEGLRADRLLHVSKPGRVLVAYGDCVLALGHLKLQDPPDIAIARLSETLNYAHDADPRLSNAARWYQSVAEVMRLFDSYATATIDERRATILAKLEADTSWLGYATVHAQLYAGLIQSLLAEVYYTADMAEAAELANQSVKLLVGNEDPRAQDRQRQNVYIMQGKMSPSDFLSRHDWAYFRQLVYVSGELAQVAEIRLP